MSSKFFLRTPRDVIDSLLGNERAAAIEMALDFSFQRWTNKAKFRDQFNLRFEKVNEIMDLMGFDLPATNSRRKKFFDKRGEYSSESRDAKPKPSPKPKTKTKASKVDSSQMEQRADEFLAVYVCLRDKSRWNPESKSIRQAVLKKLKDSKPLANKDWPHFMAVTRAYIEALKNGLEDNMHQRRPYYWIHKQDDGEPDKWLEKEYLVEKLKPEAKPKGCGQCHDGYVLEKGVLVVCTNCTQG